MNTLRITCVAIALALSVSAQADTPLVPEVPVVEKLTDPDPHWLIVNDPNFLGYLDSKVYLVDADTGEMLGMLSTGAWRSGIEMSPDFAELYVPETYYSRGNEGERTDVLGIYDVENLTRQREVIIPPKRGSGAPQRGYNGRSDDGRFVYVVNTMPAMSVTVVDVPAGEVTAEIETPGCTMVYPTGNRSFASLCGNGSMRLTQLKTDGTLEAVTQTEVFFDAVNDPITEDATRIGNRWYFVSFSGRIYEVEGSDDGLVLGETWKAVEDADHAEGWRPGGGQLIASHRSGRLFLTVNPGGDHTHKVPGAEIWVYDTASRKRVQRIEPPDPATQLAVSQDDEPLLAVAMEGPMIHLFSALTGEHVNTIEAPLLGAGIMQFAEGVQ